MSTFGEHHEKEAHSGWIKTLAEGGFPGILLHTAFVLSFAVLGWQSHDRQTFYFGLLVTLTLAVAFLSTEFQGKGVWFICTCAAVVMGQGRSSAVEEDEFDESSNYLAIRHEVAWA